MYPLNVDLWGKIVLHTAPWTNHTKPEYLEQNPTPSPCQAPIKGSQM